MERVGQVRINFASARDLTAAIPGVGRRLANAIVAVRESSGGITPEVLAKIARRQFLPEELALIDFAHNAGLDGERLDTDSDLDSDSDTESESEYESVSSSDEETPARQGRQANVSWGEYFRGLLSSTLRMLPHTSRLRHAQKPQPAAPVRPKRWSRREVGVNELVEALPQVPQASDAGQQPVRTAHPPVTGRYEAPRPLVADTPAYLVMPVAPPAPVVRCHDSTTVTTTPAAFAPVMLTAPEASTSVFTAPQPSPYTTAACSPVMSSSPQAPVVRPPAVANAAQQWQAKELLATMPKNLVFDGKGNWKSFKVQFQSYARTFGWTETECLSCLTWSLKGKALDYYAIVSEGKPDLTYDELTLKLEERFGEHDIAATIQASFHQSVQTMDETLEDWADKVLTLAARAFKGLPEHFTAEQAVSRFCQGLTDREAGHYVCMQNPISVQAAVQLVRKYQEVHSVMYGQVKPSGCTQGSGEFQSVSAVQANAEPSPSEVMQALQNLEQRLQKIICDKVEGSNPARNWSRGRSRACYQCGEVGHFKRNCPQLRKQGKKGRLTSLEADKGHSENVGSPPVLAPPNLNDKFILDTNASDYAIGAELLQRQNGVEKVIAYGSFALTEEQRRYCTTRKELLAVVHFTRQFQHYLLGKPFTVRTDYSSLRWLMRFREPQGELAGWLEELSQYDMVLQHRAGLEHRNADALSRGPTGPRDCGAYGAGVRPGDLPCGGCGYCERAHENWAAFAGDVDCDIPLANSAPVLDAQVAAAVVLEAQRVGEGLRDSQEPICDHYSEGDKPEMAEEGASPPYSEGEIYASEKSQSRQLCHQVFRDGDKPVDQGHHRVSSKQGRYVGRRGGPKMSQPSQERHCGGHPGSYERKEDGAKQQGARQAKKRPAGCSSRCVVAGCSAGMDEDHAFDAHLPLLFHPALHGKEVAGRRQAALAYIKSLLLGSHKSLVDLVTLAERVGFSKETEQPSGQLIVGMRELLETEKAMIPDDFLLRPVGNGVESLLHWKRLLALVSLLPGDDQELFRSQFESQDARRLYLERRSPGM